MNDPSEASDSEQSFMSDQSQINQVTDEQPVNMSSKRLLRGWLLFALLSLLLVLLTVRDDLRQNAIDSSEQAVDYIAFELLGWSPRELFIRRLRVAGLLDSPLGQRWIHAVDLTSKKPIQAGDQYRTNDTFEEDEVEAHIYQVTLERGEKLIWQLARLDKADSLLYASLERRKTNNEEWTTVTDLDANSETKSRVISAAGDYRIVLQPELFAKVDYSLAMATGGSLPFPVEGARQRDIGSVFGDPRDGGARKHHGVDIFAKKGTPVTAVIDGYARTGTGGLGGKHIWLSGGMFGLGSARYYYAHLDSFAVESGEKVKKGGVIGYVGNTGNARTTPPHLHFGIYAGGPVDPAPFLKPEPRLPTDY
ncbi:MAG TPA: M23 family metallopeptidase [Methylophaga aminisulfidivorans]|uniref:M23 family metallopeptidase n=1 Tax=Methylophaga TaxID=40222 RepID=UPI00175E5BFA|nr:MULTISPECIES: M23 family metallopeptidase [Methylophaga]HIC47618.1 M23 family metallopeptidase [Methylophaga sp.]HIM39051.1 M23 family metallopeptidase [Methylophaga aminisulfidivorans]